MNRLSKLILFFGMTLLPLLPDVPTSHAHAPDDDSLPDARYQWCPRWGYSFIDQGLGEDKYRHSAGFSYGVVSAAWTYAELRRNGTVIYNGYMQADGCTPAKLASGGTYQLWVAASLKHNASGVTINITPTNNNTIRWFNASWTLPPKQFGETVVFEPNMGIGDTTAGAAAIAAGMLSAQDGRFGTNNSFRVYTELPSFTGDSGSSVNLGQDEYTNGNWVSKYKSVVAHEIGHMAQRLSFGNQSHSYDDGGAVPNLCSCVHVDHAALNLHCMQSREQIGAAQTEGYAHFVAADLFNVPAQEDATFPYYKEFKLSATDERQPPVGISAYFPTAQWRWMESKSCVGTDRGTEIDWMNFFYQVNNKGATTSRFSFADIANVFVRACGGVKCNGSVTRWSDLVTAANAVAGGANTDKARYWSQIGVLQGVAH